MGRKQFRYGAVVVGEFGRLDSQPGIYVGKIFFPLDIQGRRMVLGSNGSTRFKPLDKRPGCNEFPASGTATVGQIGPPYSGHRFKLGPRVTQWGVVEEAAVAPERRRKKKGGRLARRRWYLQRNQRQRACA